MKGRRVLRLRASPFAQDGGGYGQSRATAGATGNGKGDGNDQYGGLRCVQNGKGFERSGFG
jgi:hypothetical protein